MLFHVNGDQGSGAPRSRIYKRSRSNYASARKAWEDVARATGHEPADVVETCHTDSHYCWRVRLA